MTPTATRHHTHAPVATNPTHGTVSVNADGTITYTPDSNYNGTDTFAYKANDGTTTGPAATVSVTVTP